MEKPFDPYYKWLGIPPGSCPPNHYQILGIQQFEADREVIENSADRQSMLLRAIRTTEYFEYTHKLLNEIAAARVCLLDPPKKQAYDDDLRRQLAPAARPLPQAAPIVVAVPIGAPN